MSAIQQAKLLFTEVHLLRCKEISQEFVVSVALPPSYFDKPKQDYPAVYLLDADWFFGMVTETVRIMHRCDSFPEVIVVGIGYPHDESSLERAFQETVRLRARDLTPVKDGKAEKDMNEWLQRDDVATGGGNLFLCFVQDQLMPFVENQYRARTSNRTIVGHSFGGLFVLFALFRQPQLFSKYVAASPALWYGNQITFEYERAFSKENKDLPVRLYLAAGMLEESPEHGMASDVIKLAALLKSRQYHDLTLFSKVFNECDHCAAVAPEIQNGLQMVFAGKEEQQIAKAEEPQMEGSSDGDTQ